MKNSITAAKKKSKKGMDFRSFTIGVKYLVNHQAWVLHLIRALLFTAIVAVEIPLSMALCRKSMDAVYQIYDLHVFLVFGLYLIIEACALVLMYTIFYVCLEHTFLAVDHELIILQKKKSACKTTEQKKLPDNIVVLREYKKQKKVCK